MASFNALQFKQTAREKGVPEDQINAYLQSKGLDQPAEKKASGGALGFLAPVLSLIPQAVGLAYGAKENLKTIEGVHSTIDNQAKIAQDLVKRIQSEQDPIIKEKLRKNLKTVAANQTQLTALLNDLADGKSLENATAIKLGILADIPGLSTDETRQKQQIVGRSVAQIGASAGSLLGPAGAGAVIGGARALEAGGTPMDIAKDALVGGAAGKVAGSIFAGLGKFGGTEIGQRVLASPVGSAVLKVGSGVGRLFSPFMVTSSAPGTFGADVDQVFRNFGKAIDTVYSPSFYLKGAGKAAGAIGRATGLKETPEQYLETHKGKIQDYWEKAGNKYRDIVRYDDGSPEILGQEGIIPRQVGQNMSTGAEADLVRMKARSENSLMNRILEESGLNGNPAELRRQGIEAITKNFKGTEREYALKVFNTEFDTLLQQNKGLMTPDGEIPMKTVNDIKSYFWDQGYSSKIAPKSEKVAASAMRTVGNSFKNYVNSAFTEADPAMGEAVMNLNEHTGKLLQAAKYLDAMDGRPLPYGRIGRYFAQVTGAVIGGSAGPVGSVAGTMTADQLVNLLQNPSVSVGKSALIVQQLRQTNPQVVDDAMAILQKMADAKAAQLLLPQTTVDNTVIPLYPPGRKFDYVGPDNTSKGMVNGAIQKPPTPSSFDQGAIPKTTPASNLISHEGAPDLDTIAKYKADIAAGKAVDPLKIIDEGNGMYGIEDGKHRFEAYKQLGIKNIPTEVVKTKAQDALSQVAFRGEGGPPRPFYSGNLLGPGKYVFEGTNPDAEKLAGMYGNVKAYTYNLKPSEIYDIPTEEALRKLNLNAAKAYINEIPDVDPNDLIPKYLTAKGYKAVRAVGELAKLDPNIGMNIFDESAVAEATTSQVAGHTVKQRIANFFAPDHIDNRLNDIVGYTDSGLGNLTNANPELAKKITLAIKPGDKVNSVADMYAKLRKALTPAEYKTALPDITRTLEDMRHTLDILKSMLK